MPEKIRSTTVLCVRRQAQVVMAADGQVTMGTNVVKHSASKLRLMHSGQVLAGFAGSTADALTLFERFEAKLKDFPGNVTRAAVELTKEWRTDRMLRRLEALLLVATRDKTFLLSGTGDIIEPDGGVLAIGSGGTVATAAGRALLENTDLPPQRIAEISMQLAADICIYTNAQIQYQQLS